VVEVYPLVLAKEGVRTREVRQPCKFDVEIVSDAEALSRAAAAAIVRQVSETLQEREFFTIALSGGSTPRLLFTLLAAETPFRQMVDWGKMHFFWGDERHVPPDHPQSNYRMADEALLSRVPVPTTQIHRVRAEDPDADKVADAYEQELRSLFKLEAGELPRFDCVLLGMGSDGHTASLFPGTAALNEQERLVVANRVEKFKSYRITMTVPVLNHADSIIFLVAGEAKAEALREVLQGERQPERFPAQLIQPTHGKLLWLVDKSAARLLTLPHSVESAVDLV
jgi:6-phosphogluconolactonase